MEALIRKIDGKYSYEYLDGQLLINGDCMDIMGLMDDKSIDLVLTDPPYGIGDKWVGGKGSGWGNARTQSKVRNDWDNKTPDREVFEKILKISKNQIIWGGNYFMLPPSRCWLVWNKPERNFSLAEAELGWTNFDKVVRVCDCRRSDSDRTHPTQKPMKLFTWCLNNYSNDNDLIFDAFAGSFTTTIACIKTNRKSICIELDETYYKAGVFRVKEELKQLRFAF